MTPEFVQWNSWIMCKCANSSLASNVEGGDRENFTGQGTTKLNFEGYREDLPKW